MAKRYRYAFARQREAEGGVLSVGLAGSSVLMFVIALILSCAYQGEGISGPIMGGLSVCGALLSLYGFIQGMRSISRSNQSHLYGTAGSIANGLIVIGWLWLYLMGL